MNDCCLQARERYIQIYNLKYATNPPMTGGNFWCGECDEWKEYVEVAG